MPLIIEKKQIKPWLKELSRFFEVFDLQDQVLPFKQYFLLPEQEIFVFNQKTGSLKFPKKPKEFILFNLDLADLEALTQLDEIMSKPIKDFFYFQRRQQATIIGLTDQSMVVAPGGDLILEKISPQRYQAQIVTSRGRKIMAKSKKFFKKVKNPLVKKYSQKPSQLKQMLLDPELLAEAVKWSRHDPIWDELKEVCLGCGICTYVCPLCYCFSLEDRAGLEKERCSRCRRWDACTLPGFATIAGGHSFRPTLKERYYNWFYHKFVRAYHEFGKSQCVACGRCQKYCPAGIDIEKVLLRILKNYQKKDNA